MIFEFLWPLVFLIGLPILLILYLLRPKGTPKKVPSNLLWRRLQGANTKAAFFERFLSDPLMYLEMLILLLLIAALMRPMVSASSAQGGSEAIILDTSGSMQHLCSDGKSRFSKAKEYAIAYAGQAKGKVSLITCDSTASLLLAQSTDRGALKRILQKTEVSDRAGDLSKAADLLRSLEVDSILVLTDGGSTESEDAGGFAIPAFSQWEERTKVLCFGEGSSNLALKYCAMGNGDVVALVTNYSDGAAQSTVTLSLPEGTVLSEKQIEIAAGESKSVLFQGLKLPEDAAYVKAELSESAFFGTQDGAPPAAGDSLEKDDVNYVFLEQTGSYDAALVGSGNRFLEKAYKAACGQDLRRLENETLLTNEKIVIYDYGYRSQDVLAGDDTKEQGNADKNDAAAPDAFLPAGASDPPGILRFGDPQYALGELEHTVLTFTQGEPAEGIEGASFGVNRVITYDVPEWGKSFLEADGKSCGYYGIDPQGIRRVVLGFDLRESNLPLLAEFPVMIADSMRFLADSTLIREPLLSAGEPLRLNPRADVSVESLSADTDKTGLYTIEAGEKKEYYAVLFPMDAESDGRVQGQSTNSTSQEMRRILVKKSILRGILVLVLLLLIADLYFYVKRSRYKGKSAYILSALTALLLLAALFDLRLPGKNAGHATIFLADLSDSNKENRQMMESYLSEQLAKKPVRDYYGLVTFGKEALIDQFLTKSGHYAGIQTMPVSTATDVEEAVSRAISMLPDGTSGRIVLLTDGRQTEGQLENMKSALTEPGVELCALFTEHPDREDCYIANAQMPQILHPGDSYRLNVSVMSNYETDATIALYSESRNVKQQQVHLYKGSNNFAFGMQVSGQESESFQVRVSAPGDGCSENDVYHVYSKVSAGERMLVIAGKDTDNGELGRVLSAANEDYDLVSAKNAPTGLEQLSAYKTVLLENVYIGDLPSGFLADIETFVRDYGGGLIVTGGEDSFALGGYRESVLERILPVDMEPRGIDETPSVAMVMVIDCSGSMTMDEGGGPTRLDLAIESACRAVDNLTGKDYVGVIAFDDTPEWQVPIVQVKDKDAIKQAIQKVREGGGTMIKPAVQEAYEGLAKQEAATRHILLLTDGQGETTDFRDLTAAINDAGITLSSVAVGDDADKILLQSLAAECGGRFYASDRQSDIPRIFAKEVFMSGDSYLQNGDFALSVDGNSELTAGLFEEGWPHISGYVASTQKPGAACVIESDKADPVLTAWQYGLGRAVAWNTDVSGIWTGGFSGKEDYAALWKRISDYSFGSETDNRDLVEYVAKDAEGGTDLVRFTTQQYSDKTAVSGLYTTPSGERRELRLTQKRPGVYEAPLEESEAGVYFLSVGKEEDGQQTGVVTGAAILQFSDEYRYDTTDAQVKTFVEHYGRLLTPEESVWTRQKTRVTTAKSMVTAFLIAAALLFMLGIAERRMELMRLLAAAMAKRKEAKQAAAAAQTPVQTETQSAAQTEGQPQPAAQTGAHSGAQIQRQAATQTPAQGQTQPAVQTGAQFAAQGQVLDTSYLLKKKRDRNGFS